MFPVGVTPARGCLLPQDKPEQVMGKNGAFLRPLHAIAIYHAVVTCACVFFRCGLGDARREVTHFISLHSWCPVVRFVCLASPRRLTTWSLVTARHKHHRSSCNVVVCAGARKDHSRQQIKLEAIWCPPQVFSPESTPQCPHTRPCSQCSSSLQSIRGLSIALTLLDFRPTGANPHHNKMKRQGQLRTFTTGHNKDVIDS